MSIIVIANLSVKEESLEELKKYLKEILPDTRSFEGCQGVQLYENKESPNKINHTCKMGFRRGTKEVCCMENGNRCIEQTYDNVI